MKIPFLNLASPELNPAEELSQAAERVIRSGRFLHGSETDALEKRLSGLFIARHAIGVSNGLDAIRLILRAYIELGQLKPGDVILLPANTYIASFLPVSDMGLTPRPVDIDPSTLNIDFNLLQEAAAQSDAKGIILVHLYGNPAWNLSVMQELKKRGLIIIEDNAQAIGAIASQPGLNGTKITGSLADASAISFYPTKNIGALGDAGAVITSDSRLAETVKTLANYGSIQRYNNVMKGYNCRIDELQAAFLNVKLNHLSEINQRRRERALLYNSLICNSYVELPEIMEDSVQVWHQYVIRTDHRDRLIKHLADNGIATDIHYPVPPHRQPCYPELANYTMPVAEHEAKRILSLPIGSVSNTEIEYIASIINLFNPF